MNPNCFSKEEIPLENNQRTFSPIFNHFGMKKIWVLLMALTLTVGLSAQDASSDQTASKDNKMRAKEQRVALIQQQYIATSGMLDSMNFVLEATSLRNSRGSYSIVPSQLNFIMVDSSKAIIQVGSYTRMGANGVGGVTAKGSVSNWKLDKNDKRKSFTVSLSVMSPIGMYDVVMYISADGTASATLSGLQPGQLYFNGRVVPLTQSRVWEGRSI